MNIHTLKHQTQRGFTLIEIAMVMLIIALLLTGLVPTISSQVEQQRVHATLKELAEIKEALIGYAAIHGSLPCPSTTTDPSNSNYGVADTSCSASLSSEGHLPWKTLGITETDAWGSKRINASDPWVGQWWYRVDRNFATTFTLTTGFSTDSLLVKDNNGNNLTTASERPIAIVYSTGKDITANGQNSSFEATSGIYQSDTPTSSFDDIMIWISRPQLFNRLVMAGKLP